MSDVLTLVLGLPTWSPSAGVLNPMTTLGDVITGGVAGVATRLGVGANGEVLTVVAGVPGWAAGGGFANPMTTAGDIITGGVAGAAQRLAVGADGTILTVVAGAPDWAAAGGFVNPMTTAGDLIRGGAAGVATRLAGSGVANALFSYVAGVPAWNATATLTAAGDAVFNDVAAAAARFIGWVGRSALTSPADGNVMLANNAGTSFGLLQLGGTAATFPALKRSSAGVQVRLADDSAFAALTALDLAADAARFIGWVGRSAFSSPSDGVVKIANNAGNDFGRLAFGDTGAGFPALKRSATTLQVRLGDDSTFAPFTASAYNVGAVAGISFSGAITNLTVVNGLVTAAS